MTTQHETITLATANTPQAVVPKLGGNARDIVLQNNNDTEIIYLGGSNVTASNYGYRLLPNSAISFQVDGEDEIWAVATVNNTPVHVLRVTLAM